MRCQNLFWGMIAVVVMTATGCGAAVPVSQALPPVDLAAIAITDSSGAPCGEQLALTIDDTLALNAALPTEGVLVDAVSSHGAVAVEVVGGQLSLKAVEAGSADITITFSAQGLTPVERVLHTQVELREQELTAVLVPVPQELETEPAEEGLISPTAAVKVVTPTDTAEEQPEPTCAYDKNALTLQTGTVSALDLVGEENTVFTLTTDGDKVDAALQDGLLLVTGREAGTAIITVTGEKSKYKPAVLTLSVEVVLPPVQLTMTAQGQNPQQPTTEVGGTVKITVKTEPADAVLSVESDSEGVTASLSKGVLTLVGKKEGSAKLTLKAVREGFADFVQEIPVVVSSKRVPLSLTCPQMGSNNTITLLQGAQTTVTATPGAKAELTYQVDGNAVELVRNGNLFTVKGNKAGTTKVTFICKAEGLSDHTQTLTIVVTQPQIVLTAAQSINLVPGTTGTLRYSVTPADAEVTASCDGSLAKVRCTDGTLTVEALKAGKGTITLTAKKEGYATRTQSVYLTAGQSPVQLTLGSSYLSGTPGEKLTVSCKTIPADASITTRVSGTAEARYSDGVITVTPSSPGSATITVTASKEGYADATRTITLSVGEKALLLNVSPDRLDSDGGTNAEIKDFKIKVSVVPADATVKYTAVGSVRLSNESNTGVDARVSGAGKVIVRASKEGYATVERTIQATQYGVQEFDGDISGFADEVFRIVNRERAAQGVGALERNYEVEAAANIRAQELTEKYSHTRQIGRAHV